MAEITPSLNLRSSRRSPLREARALLSETQRAEPVWPLLAAAALVALAALCLAAAVILGPPKAPAGPEPQLRLKPAVSKAGRASSVEAPGFLGRPPQRAGLV